MFEVLHVDEIADDEKVDKEEEGPTDHHQPLSPPHPEPPDGKQRPAVVPAGVASTQTQTTNTFTTAFTIPKTRHVSVVSAGNRVQRHNLTCFRCGGPHHFRSECSSFRTKLCSQWKVGCCQEAYCPFAHGIENLRRPWLVSQEDSPVREG